MFKIRLAPRLDREKRTIQAMLRLYCRDHHGTRPGGELCGACQTLLGYAWRRLDTCPFQALKPACNTCQVHCYSKSMREQVRQVMRYSGPRLLLRHPVLSLYHLLDTYRPAPSLDRPRRGSKNNP